MKTPEEWGQELGAKLGKLKPRWVGAFFFLCSVVALLVNFAMVMGMERYSQKLLLFSVCFLPMSLWVLVTGRSGTRNEPKAPLWWWMGSIVLIAVSALASLYLVLTARY